MFDISSKLKNASLTYSSPITMSIGGFALWDTGDGVKQAGEERRGVEFTIEGSGNTFSDPGGIWWLYALDVIDSFELSINHDQYNSVFKFQQDINHSNIAFDTLDDKSVITNATDIKIVSGKMTDVIFTSLLDTKGEGNGQKNLFVGNNAQNTLLGNGGSDDLFGRDGNDKLYGGSGNDDLLGENGHDIIMGGTGDDKIFGGDGNDEQNGQDGHDLIRSHAGDDIARGGNGDDRLEGQSGNDALYGGAGNDELYGHVGRDIMHGGAGNDDLYGGQWVDNIYGGDDNDYIYGGQSNDNLYGNSGLDNVFGGDGKDRVHGNDGIDNLSGGNGNDQLFGGGGSDDLFGGNGNDRLDGSAGFDELWGGDGADRFILKKDQARDTIIDFDRTEGDKIWLDADFFAPGTTTQDVIDNYTSVTSGGFETYLDLQGSDFAFIRGVTDLEASDLVLF